ncbi:hypothetical protein [Thiobacillus sp.]|jgi:hypothetical protein|nr:hypothetical protein [Thiobacillus sp.]
MKPDFQDAGLWGMAVEPGSQSLGISGMPESADAKNTISGQAGG